jgi:phosphoserine phosphatase
LAIELIIFDMDGVIFEGRNFWLDLHYCYSTEAEGLALAAHDLKDDYKKAAEFTAEALWRDRPAAPFFELVRERVYQDGVFELFDYLRRRRVKTAIVSSGPLQLAVRAQHDLGIDEVRANELAIVDGRISGRVDIGVIDSEKVQVSLDVMRSIGVAPDQTAAVGDTESDVETAATVGLAVAYDSVSPDLDRVAHVHLCKGELRRLIEVIEAWDRRSGRHGRTD